MGDDVTNCELYTNFFERKVNKYASGKTVSNLQQIATDASLIMMLMPQQLIIQLRSLLESIKVSPSFC